MSALAEALVAAQRRAIAAMEKAYVAGRLDRDTTIAALDGIGATDAVDRDRLLLALDVIREWGATLPAEAKPANGDGEPAKATGAQVAYAQSLFQRGDLVPLAESDLRNMPRERISALIEHLKAGTYDANEWDVAFSKRWQAIIDAKIGPCRVCVRPWSNGGARSWHPYPVHFHHLVPRSLNGDDTADNIVPLCSDCHGRVTSGEHAELQALAASLTDAEYAYVIGKLGEGALERLYGVGR